MNPATKMKKRRRNTTINPKETARCHLKSRWHPCLCCCWETCLDLLFWCSQALCWCQRPELPPKVLQMFVACAAVWSHVDVWAVLPWMPYSREWPALSPEAILMYTVQNASKGLVWVCAPIVAGGNDHGLCCHQKPWGSPWIYAPIVSKEQGSYFCSDVVDCRCTIEKEGSGKTSVTTPTQETNSLNGKQLKRAL